MRVLISVALVVLGALALGACNSTERTASAVHPDASTVKPPTTVQADGARRITVPEAQSLLEKGQAVVIDVRNQAAYDQGHVKGAKLIPSNEIADRTSELPRDKTIITYCSWPNEHTSASSVVSIKAKGIDNAAALLGGFDAWKKAGLPVEAKQ